MEVLFVLLVIALVVSFAAPAFRSMRYDIKNTRAKNALKKLAEARRSFYEFNKGAKIAEGHFDANDAQGYAATACINLAASGKPGVTSDAQNVSQLFACQFLDWRDFAGLPYTFYVCNMDRATITKPCNNTNRYAGAIGNSNAGPAYNTSATDYFMYVGIDMNVHDTAED